MGKHKKTPMTYLRQKEGRKEGKREENIGKEGR